MPAKIIDLDCCDCSTKLAKAFNGRELTVEEFDLAMLRFAAERRRKGGGGYSKLRGKFVFGEDSIEFRIDVDAEMKEGRTLARVWKFRSLNADTERGREYLKAIGKDADEVIDIYRRAAFAAI